MSAPEVDRESGSGELFLSVFPLLEFSATFSFLCREFSFSLFGEFFFSDCLLDWPAIRSLGLLNRNPSPYPSLGN